MGGSTLRWNEQVNASELDRILLHWAPHVWLSHAHQPVLSMASMICFHKKEKKKKKEKKWMRKTCSINGIHDMFSKKQQHLNSLQNICNWYDGEPVGCSIVKNTSVVQTLVTENYWSIIANMAKTSRKITTIPLISELFVFTLRALL